MLSSVCNNIQYVSHLHGIGAAVRRTGITAPRAPVRALVVTLVMLWVVTAVMAPYTSSSSVVLDMLLVVVVVGIDLGHVL